MLHEGCVSKKLLALVRKLEKEEIFKDYFLVGGTALALQIGHRKSDDIDLFSQKELHIQGERTMKLLSPKRNPNGTTGFPDNPLTKPFVGRGL